jgi:hypothetical protein
MSATSCGLTKVLSAVLATGRSAEELHAEAVSAPVVAPAGANFQPGCLRLATHAGAEECHAAKSRAQHQMQGFKSPSSAQRFVSIDTVVYNIFNIQRHLVRRPTLRRFRAEAHQAWNNAAAAA